MADLSPVSNPESTLDLLSDTYAAQVKTCVSGAASDLDLAVPATDAVASERVTFIACCKRPIDVSAYGGFLFDAGVYYGLSPALLSAILITESGGNPTAVNPAGPAYGLMQIYYSAHRAWFDGTTDPKTGKVLTKPADWKDPQTNIDYGASILRGNYLFFRSTTEQVRLPPGVQDPRPLTGFPLTLAAVAAYNRGPGNVLKDMATGVGADGKTERVRGVGYASAVLRQAAAMSESLQAQGSVFGNAANSLALVIAAPAATVATQVYRRAYDGLAAFQRAKAMAATERPVFYAESAAVKLRRAAAIGKDALSAREAVPLYAEPSPGFTEDENLLAASFDFTTGRWGKTGPMT